MAYEKAKKEFKRHYKRAMKLKEGGKVWEREINLANKWKEIGTRQYQEMLEARYN